MTRFVCVSESSVPKGRTALLLFVHEARLCAGLLEHRYDGRILRHRPDNPKPTDLIPAISQAMDRRSLDSDCLVVIEPDAYWPEQFPVLHDLRFNNIQV